jgi:hypothetical protein
MENPANDNSNGRDNKTSKLDLKNMIQHYLASNPTIPKDRKISELEIRFGTNYKNPITKIHYNDVVNHLYSNGFKTDNSRGGNMLRVYPEEIDTRTGQTRISETRIRAEIIGIDLIQEYCQSNSIQKILDIPSTLSNKIKFTSKVFPKDKNGKPIFAVDLKDFQIRVSHQLEQDFSVESNIARNIISKWSDSKKTFRFINRTRFEHPEYPIFADISILKSSKKQKGKGFALPEYTIQESGVFQNIETYEIELEIDNMKVGTGTSYQTADQLLEVIQKTIRIVLGALQGTHYPISYDEQNLVLQSYMKIIHGENYQPRQIRSNDFIGPSSYTLQIENISDNSETENSLVPNIQNNYTVTDKADGDRKLLFVSGEGKIYLINTNMNVQYTGTKTEENTLFNSILDGEHIKYDKTGKYIHMYAAFDVYYIHGKSVREFDFYGENENGDIFKPEKDENPKSYRLLMLKKILSNIEKGLNPKSAIQTQLCTDFTVKCKEFYATNENTTIFDACSFLLTKIRDGLFEYNTDGLIFTPANTGVGGSSSETAGPKYKISWERSFKWKPVEFNTIDFLVSFKKNKEGKNEIHTIFQEGTSTSSVNNIMQYQTIILRCGFDKTRDIFINPFQSIIDDTLPTNEYIPNEEKYQPIEFRPTDPYDPGATFCNIMLEQSGTSPVLIAESGEQFEEDMIVEFKYDMTKNGYWKWIPLRVRYDKTAELKSGKKNYGNSYAVANNNWHSIHYPITDEMLSTGLNISQNIGGDDVYYVPSGDESQTRSLRDFHNRFVKSKLVSSVSHGKRGLLLIDYAVGKAGDLQKWIRNHLQFVFGIDISRDNIHNSLDGACARYLREVKRTYKAIDTKVLFVTGNSSLNIRSGEALTTDKDKQICRAIFGQGPKDRKILGEGVYRQYGVAETGFHISSVQFALHYFFENRTTFHHFLRNVAECTRIGGYFIGTCYDGKNVFRLLKDKNLGDNFTIMKTDSTGKSKKIFEIIKQYSETGFPDDELGLGYAIDVYQESIGKTFREYLVNFEFFTRVLENYGFVLLEKEEAQKINLPNGSGLFSELFTTMEEDIRRNPRLKSDYGQAGLMSSEEKTISFLNRYFVFRKTRDVKNTEKIEKIVLLEEREEQKEVLAIEDEYDIMRLDSKPNTKNDKESQKIEKKKTKARKIKSEKMIVEEYSPIVEDLEPEPKEPEPEPKEPEPKEPEQKEPEPKEPEPTVIYGKPVVLKRKKLTIKNKK